MNKSLQKCLIRTLELPGGTRPSTMEQDLPTGEQGILGASLLPHDIKGFR